MKMLGKHYLHRPYTSGLMSSCSLVIFAVVTEAFDMFVFRLLHAFTAFGTFEAPAVLTAQCREEFGVTERGAHVSAVFNHAFELVVSFYFLR